MTDISYKNRIIRLDGDTLKFFIVGEHHSRQFASAAAAQKAIDKATPEVAFKPFSIVQWSGADTYHSEPEKPEVHEVVGVRYHGTGKTWARGLRFITKAGKELSGGRYGAGNLYDIKDLPKLEAAYTKAVELSKKKEAIEKELKAIDEKVEDRSVRIEAISEELGNGTPHAI